MTEAGTIPLPQASTLPHSDPASSVARIKIGSLGIDTYSEAGLIDDVLEHALHGQNTRQIITANAQFYVLAEKSPVFRSCLEAAEYICADGMPIVWACNRYVGKTVPRIAGVDLIEDVCRRGAASGLRVFLLGGRPATAQATAEVLRARYPGLEIAGVNCPPFGFETTPETLAPVLEAIAASKPHILFVGLGAPKQEYFIAKHVRPLCVPIAIGIGGSFEILSGCILRAPEWMQAIGLEWAFRLAKEPRRLWKRYLIGNVEFILSLAKWRFRTLRYGALEPAFKRS